HERQALCAVPLWPNIVLTGPRSCTSYEPPTQAKGDSTMSAAGEMIDVGGMPAYLARPAGNSPWPALPVVQEAVRLNDHIKDVARRVAAEGYVALAPDLFYRGGKGRTARYDDLPAALGLMGALKDDEIVADVSNAIAHLERQPFVRRGRTGITGFCM